MKMETLQVGDKVESKDHMFWMTVSKITSKGVVCTFGKKGIYAGTFNKSELKKLEG